MFFLTLPRKLRKNVLKEVRPGAKKLEKESKMTISQVCFGFRLVSDSLSTLFGPGAESPWNPFSDFFFGVFYPVAQDGDKRIAGGSRRNGSESFSLGHSL